VTLSSGSVGARRGSSAVEATCAITEIVDANNRYVEMQLQRVGILV
jgi:hypothetical protein